MSARVLIVDGSRTVRLDLGTLFESNGYEVTLCSSMPEARARLTKQRFDLLVLDEFLFENDGPALLREQTESHRLFVLLLSEGSAVGRRPPIDDSSVFDVVRRPYNNRQILEKVRRLLERPLNLTRPLVLLIDDSLTDRNKLRALLESAEYRTRLVTAGDEGLREAARIAPAAVVVDGTTIGVDGPEVIRRLRLAPELQSTPCLLVSSSVGARHRMAAVTAGADVLLQASEEIHLLPAKLRDLVLSFSEAHEETQRSTRAEPAQILAVDDSVSYLGRLTERLKKQGYTVFAATNGEEAIAFAETRPVDAILMDLVMPGLSGVEACRRLKKSKDHQNIPLILMTAHDGLEGMLEGIEAGADDYVAKSADFVVLLARLRAHLRRREIEAEHRRMQVELVRRLANVEAARELAEKNALLESNTFELATLNAELEGFAYSVSHDLRQPLRSLDGFSRVLLERYNERLDDKGKHYLNRIRESAQRMAVMINGLLALSRLSRVPLRRSEFKLDVLAKRVLRQLHENDPDRTVHVVVQDDLMTSADSDLTQTLLENLLENAWKFTGNSPAARIELSTEEHDGELIYAIRDNGVGFDMAYADKLFGPFQRLHSVKEFAGTGIGLATVQRIVQRHGGRVWAESLPGEGATVRFTLTPPNQGDPDDEP